MTAEGHLLFSVATLVLAQKLEITPVLAQGDWFHMIPAVLLGSLLPDLDHPGSILGRLFRIISLPLSKLCGHRGFTHSLLAFCGLAILWETQVAPYITISADFFSRPFARLLKSPTGRYANTIRCTFFMATKNAFCLTDFSEKK